MRKLIQFVNALSHFYQNVKCSGADLTKCPATMYRIHAIKALLPEGWAKDVLVEFEDDGRIGRIQTDAGEVDGQNVGIHLPALVNAHSHAFLRAMAGLTERRGPDPNDSFWTWRQLMFRFLNCLSPDDVEAITAFVQMEMLEAGYGAQLLNAPVSKALFVVERTTWENETAITSVRQKFRAGYQMKTTI